MTDLDVVAGFIQRAVCPEEVFGPLSSPADLKKSFAKLSKAVHPDVNNNSPVAKELFQELSAFRDEAEKRLAAGTYGNRAPVATKAPVVINGRYVKDQLLCSGDIADLYLVSLESSTRRRTNIMKIARSADDNDLIKAEANVINLIRPKLPENTIRLGLPNVVDSFRVDGRQANVMSYFYGFYTAEQVLKMTGGVDDRTMAWMWKRLLTMIGWIQKLGYVHGAILPSHVLFYPDNDGQHAPDNRKHALRLVDWCYAVDYKRRTRLSAWVPEMQIMYAPEILDKKPLSGKTDLYMGAMLMVHLLGNKISMVPSPVLELLQVCTKEDPGLRPQSVGDYFDKFVDTLKRVYGPPKWHKFNLPGLPG